MNIECTGQNGFGPWRKSSYSEPNGNACVEVAFGPTVVGLRDSKNPAGPRLAIGQDQWLAFLAKAAAAD